VFTQGHSALATEEIARLAGHRSTRMTETVYRHELRLVIRSAAAIMNKIFSQARPRMYPLAVLIRTNIRSAERSSWLAQPTSSLRLCRG
jgi:hypothetical protein